jgi:hypothetical protein
MSPYDKLAEAYARNPQADSFENYVLWLARSGFVFARPDFFAMGRPVVRAAARDLILDVAHLFPSASCDAWFIHAAAGNMSRMWSIMPWELGWIGFTRINDPLSELQFFPTERLKRLCPPDLNIG